jgi:hypothetical protein
MGQDHQHGHEHDHHHERQDAATADWADPSVPDSELSPGGLDRRRFLQRAGLLGAAVLAGGTAAARPAAAQAAEGPGRVPLLDDPRRQYGWFAGDHHIHTRFSPDAIYLVQQQAEKAVEYGLDWMVITDHGGPTHQKLSIDPTAAEIEAARATNDILIYQGVEWNIPAGEHATVFVAPGPGTVEVLKSFEGAYDGVILAANGEIARATENSPEAEAFAYEGLRYLAEQVAAGNAPDAVMLPNHVSRRGVDSPHELRTYRDTAPGIAVGMEGASGHQAAGIPEADRGLGDDRGFYGNTPNPDSFAGYPTEAYFTWGGFDYNVSKIGGLYDSLLAEGKRWCITATSDSHFNHLETFRRGGTEEEQTSAYWQTTGAYLPPVDTGVPSPAGDFWPGYYSTTLVGAASRDYLAIMEGLRASRTYAVHGGLVRGVDLRIATLGRSGSYGSTVGGRAQVARGGNVFVSIAVDLANSPNFNGDVPRLAKVDLIAGPITGASADLDRQEAPGTAVIESFEVSRLDRRRGRAVFRHVFRNVRGSFFLRLRGSDGNQVDQFGNPTIDVSGDDDPWADLWFYSSGAFVEVV